MDELEELRQLQKLFREYRATGLSPTAAWCKALDSLMF
jgi:hypothetical protein